jgi:similar to stage IV sporulation protein
VNFLILALVRYLKGYVLIEVNGFFVEKFLNLCTDENIIIWDIKKNENGSLNLKMTLRAFKKIRRASYRTRTNVKILKRYGIKFFINNSKNRKGLVIGFILSFFMFVFLTSFIWSVDISGNEKIKDEEIMSLLKEAGFKKGMLRFNIDEEKIKNNVLLKTEDLSWIWVEIKGTRAFVEVREKKEKPEIFDKTTPSNIVAKRNGLVTKVIAKSGDKVVCEGDVVSKGDLLITGVKSDDKGEIKYYNSSGNVFARTWHEKCGKIEPKEVVFTKSLKKISKRTINLFGFDVLLYIDKKIPYKHFEKEEMVKRFPLIPVTYKKATYFELIKTEKSISKEEAVKRKSELLKKELEKTLDDKIEIIKKDVTYTEEKNGIINVKVIYECSEDIAQKIYIN